MNAAELRHANKVAALPCLVCRRLGQAGGKVELHHVAEGSGKRSWFAVAPLCAEHHRGLTGLHGMGAKKFCSFYRLPGEAEWGLLVLVNEDLAKEGKW